MNKPLSFICLLASILISCTSEKEKRELLWRTFPLGEHPVGFRVMLHSDSSRLLDDSTQRPIQISYWYPAAIANEKQVSFQDYFLLSNNELGGDAQNKDSLVANYKKLAVSSGVTQTGIDSVFASTMSAFSGPKAATESNSVILIAQGNGHSIFNQVVLAEYLASRGYHVLSTPSPTRISGRYATYEGLATKAREQADDLAFAKQIVEQERNKLFDQTGMVAYSFGGRSAMIYSKLYSLDALVSWDSGIGNEYGMEWLNYVEEPVLNDLEVPFIHFYQPGDRSVLPSFQAIDSLFTKSRYLVRIDSVNHGFFMIRGAADAAFQNFQENPYPNAGKKYNELLRMTHKSLEELLAEDKLSTAAEFPEITSPGEF